MQNFFFHLFLQEEELAHRYLNIWSFDKAVKDCCDEFSKSIFFGQGFKSSYSNKSFLLPNTCLKKWKKLTAKIYLIVCALTETKDHINPFQVDLLSPHHQFFDILGGYKEWPEMSRP